MSVRVVLAAAGETWESVVIRSLQRAPDDLVLSRRCMDVADLVAVAAAGQADAALVSPALPGLDTDVVRRLSDAGTVCIAITDAPDDAELMRCRQLGIPTTLSWRDLDRLAEAIAESEVAEDPVDPPSDEARRTGAASVRTGRVVAVWGPTGAPGRSTVAIGVSAESAAAGVATGLLDIDVYGGAVAPMLAIVDETSGVLAAARQANTGTLDAPALRRHLRTLAPDLHVLTGFPRADRWPQLRPGALAGVLDVTGEVVDNIVLDCGFCTEQDEELSFDTAAPRRNGATVHALGAADVVVAVGSADPVGITRLSRAVVDLADVIPGADVRVVMNRVRPGMGWSQDEIADTVERFTGRRPIAFLPEDVAARDRAVLTGQTLVAAAPTSRLRRELQALAGQLLNIDVEPVRRRSGFRSRRAAAH